MANVTTTTTPAVNPYQTSMDAMAQNATQQAEFQMKVQEYSATTTAVGTATKLITDSHQEAGNAVKSVSNNAVESSRR